MSGKFDNPFQLLMNRDVYAILDGDAKFEAYFFIDNGEMASVAMPYLSGPDLCDISKKFGLPRAYDWNGGNPSRWQYVEDLLEHCIKEQRCSELLSFLFSKNQFSSMFVGHNTEAIKSAHSHYMKTIIGKINGILYFSGHELVQIGQVFSIKELSSTIGIEAPRIQSVDRDYIKNMSIRAMEDVERKNYDSALTKSRTLLEEVFCYVIEQKGKTPSDDGNITRLYGQMKSLYSMHTNKETDRRINDLLAGLGKIVSSVGNMRNEAGDSHGTGARRISIDEHHARLVVNAATTMADFILAVEERANNKRAE